MEVTVIVPVWNRRDLLERLLLSLRNQTYAGAEVLVIDDGSEDGSAGLAESLGARAIRLGEHGGFARAVNRGIRESRTPLLAIVNNDVELAPDWLEKLEAGLESGAWFATGRILQAAAPDYIDATYDALCRGGTAHRVGHGCPDGPLFREAREIRFVPFTAALFRAELFDKVGLLDERFESYLEDIDFGLRCALAGYMGRYVPEAVAWHAGSATLGRWHPGYYMADRAESGVAGRQALPAAIAASLRLANCGRAGVVGIDGFVAWTGLVLDAGEGGGDTALCGVSRQAGYEAAAGYEPAPPRRNSQRKRARDFPTRARSLLGLVLSTHRRWGKVTHD